MRVVPNLYPIVGDGVARRARGRRALARARPLVRRPRRRRRDRGVRRAARPRSRSTSPPGSRTRTRSSTTARPPGASIEHPHAQVVALDFVPPLVDRVLDRFATARARPRRTTPSTRRAPRRASCATATPSIVVPAGVDRRPYAVRVALAARAPALRPRDRRRDRARSPIALQRRSCAACAPCSATSPYNVVVHTAPARRRRGRSTGGSTSCPGSRCTAGFELGTGLCVSTVAPDAAAAALREARDDVHVGITIDAPPGRGVARRRADRDATSTGWPTRSRSRSRARSTAASAPRSTASRKIGPFRTTDRMIVTEWEPGRAMGIEHRGLFTGRGPLHAARRRGATARASPGPRSSTFPWWMGGAVGARRGQAGAAPRCGAATCAASTRLVASGARSIRRMTYAVSVAGLQTLGAPTVARRRARSRRARLRRRSGSRRRTRPRRCRCSARSARSRRTSGSAPACSRCNCARRRCTRWPRATLQQLAGDRDVFLGIGISSPAVAGQWHGAGYTDRPIAQVREFVTLLRECLSGETVTLRRRLLHGEALPARRAARRAAARRSSLAALNEQMLRLGGEIADGVLLNYLPGVARAVVRRAGAQGRRRRRSTRTCTAA